MVSSCSHVIWRRLFPVVLSAGLIVAPSYAFAVDPSAGSQTGSGATEVTVVNSGTVVKPGTDELSPDKPSSPSNPAAGNVTRTASVGGTSGGGGGASGGNGKLSKTGDYAVSSFLLALAALTGIALVGSGVGLRRRGEACDA